MVLSFDGVASFGCLLLVHFMYVLSICSSEGVQKKKKHFAIKVSIFMSFQGVMLSTRTNNRFQNLFRK